MKKTGAGILVESLRKEGVEHVFGFPGGAVLDIYDELYKEKVKHILVRHEQGAAHAADGYARAAGKVGVCLVTSGPGATNTVTGIASAYMDSIPIVVFTGQVSTPLIGNDAFQEADIVGITRPCTKHNYLVKDVNDLARTVKEAFYIARSGRPGPVLVDLPKDVLQAKAEFKYPAEARMLSYNPTVSAHLGQVEKAFKLMRESERPVLYVGGGVIHSEAATTLRQVAEAMAIPVTATLMGLGGFPGTHKLWMGMLGMHGTYTSNMAVANSDCLIAVGARFDDRVTGRVDTFAPQAKIIHIDIDPSSISKNVRVDIPIVGDCKDALSKLHGFIKDDKRKGKAAYARQHAAWLTQIAEWDRTHPLSYKQEKDEIKPQFVVEKIYELTKGEAIISTEVGQNQMWAAQFYRFNHPRAFLSSGGLGCMGYGFPAAIGAQVACPDRLVIDIAGDGSIQMNIQELATAVQYELPVKVCILNNNYLGMVRQWQELFYGKRYSHTCLECSPDFVKIAEAYGAMGLRATKPSEVEGVIRQALKAKTCVFIDFRVAQEEGVYPMVPAGKPMTEMLLV